MTTVAPVDVDWLVLLVNGCAPQAQEAAGADAVRRDQVDHDLPDVAARTTARDRQVLAQGLWPVFGAETTARRVAALESLLAVTDLAPRVDADGLLTWSTSRERPADRLAASCLASVLALVTTYGWSRLGSCVGCDCVDVYVDRSRRGSRTYCSTTCLNRAKVRAFRARQATP